ncbi:MAG TPA: hypothetical protein PLQ13_04010 [Candidatus Krumholzibacteria bacterium]|nr:hypothetical protein [Candidatus Krumholzibacteria bacterium]
MKMMLKVAALLAVLALPGFAFATTLTSVTGTADCDGWSVDANIHWGSALTATLSYTANLVDEGGATVASTSSSQVLNNPGTTYQDVWYMGAWGQELCGTYTATVHVTLVAPLGSTGNFETTTGEFQATFTCDCATHICNYTPGYWKNHAENWPVTSLTLGGVTYDQAHLLAIMNTPVRGDATIILAYHLIAAKLNVLSGSDPSINPAISEADALLAMYPLRSKPSGAARDQILDVKNQLAAYNELECPDGPIDSGSKAMPDEEPASWGQLKASYR